VFQVEVYGAVRRYVLVEEHSRREAARVFGLSRDTIAKMCRFSVPPGYQRSKPPEKPKLGPLMPVIDAILASDRSAPPKQRHTAQRIFERLRSEYGYAGGYTVVKNYVRLKRVRMKEAFVPLTHPPGHAQVDFGQCIGIIDGVRMVLHVFCFDLPHSDAPFVKPIRRRRRKHSWTGMFRPLPSSAGCRSRSFTTTASWRWPGSWATASASARALSPSWSAISCFGIASAGRARATIRGKSKGW